MRVEEEGRGVERGYPTPKGKEFTPDEDSSASDHSDSEFYEEIRDRCMLEYGWDSIEMIKAMDRITNYSGTEPLPTAGTELCVGGTELGAGVQRTSRRKRARTWCGTRQRGTWTRWSRTSRTGRRRCAHRCKPVCTRCKPECTPMCTRGCARCTSECTPMHTSLRTDAHHDAHDAHRHATSEH
eukprot:108157-Rhodomonas_salina.1